jgi:flagellar hook-associated protein 3 FlgL
MSGDQFFVGPSQNQDIFATLQSFVDAMASNPTDDAGRAQLTQSMNAVIGDVDQALTHIVETRTRIGARMNVIDSVRDENEATKFQLEKSLSDVRDLDYAEAISRLEFQLTALQALQATFSRIAGLSLFNLLR